MSIVCDIFSFANEYVYYRHNRLIKVLDYLTRKAIRKAKARADRDDIIVKVTVALLSEIKISLIQLLQTRSETVMIAVGRSNKQL